LRFQISKGRTAETERKQVWRLNGEEMGMTRKKRMELRKKRGKCAPRSKKTQMHKGSDRHAEEEQKAPNYLAEAHPEL
jgi:hypothetical protein